MLVGPDTLPPTATVAEARAAFESPRHKLLVVADGTRYVGSIDRGAVENADDATPLGELRMADVPTLSPDDPTSAALELDASRTPVVDDGGELVGLVCFNRTRGSFCVMKD
jgi:CBS domain-containing protein